MKYATPESCGISTADIKYYVDMLEADGLATHSLIIARGDNIIFEKYWEPFDRDFKHRLYSVTKSFASLAIGFAEQDGLISLDDEISRYFPEECKSAPDDYARHQTVRDMLMMRSAYPNSRSWFNLSPDDRVLNYFADNRGSYYPSGSLFRYDSTGSFILGSLVERVTGRDIIDYLNEKLFSKIGVEGAYTLKCPGGHSWMDSALLMRPIDLMKTARFVLSGGKWNGEQILNENYVKTATSNLVPTTNYGERCTEGHGYGYQIWRTKHNSFFFNGMGCQLAVCNPDKDLILVYNSDNQGNPIAKAIIMNGFFDIIHRNAKDTPLPEYTGEPIGDLKLFACSGSYDSPVSDNVIGKRYVLSSNPMGIEYFTLDISGDEGSFTYKNNSGEKSILFGMNKNVFSKFPEEGYSDEIGSKSAPGHKYDSAASAAWICDNTLLIRVQVIDKYFGNMSVALSFVGDEVAVRMMKNAENFLGGYDGYAKGKQA